MIDKTYHDDETLTKVREGLRSAWAAVSDATITDAITGMQNAGILFREVPPHDRAAGQLDALALEARAAGERARQAALRSGRN